MSHPIFEQLLVPILVRFFLVFGIFGFAIGAGLIFNHGSMFRFFAIMNRWVSLRRSTRWLAIPRDTGPVVQRWRLPLGAAFILVATFSAFVLITQVDAGRIVAALHFKLPDAFVLWLVESGRWCLIAGSMVAIAAGIMLIFFPNALQALEMRTNRWYSFRGVSRRGDTLNMGLDRWLASHPRAMGGLVAGASLFVVVDYGMLLFAQR